VSGEVIVLIRVLLRGYIVLVVILGVLYKLLIAFTI